MNNEFGVTIEVLFKGNPNEYKYTFPFTEINSSLEAHEKAEDVVKSIMTQEVVHVVDIQGVHVVLRGSDISKITGKGMQTGVQVE